MTIKEVEERTGLSRSNIRFMKRKNLLSLREMKVMVIEIILKMMENIKEDCISTYIGNFY